MSSIVFLLAATLKATIILAAAFLVVTLALVFWQFRRDLTERSVYRDSSGTSRAR